MEQKFRSFNELFETMTRGNEVVFEWDGRRYCLFAEFEGQRQTGYLIGPTYSEEMTFCKNKQELSQYRIGGRSFCDIVPEICVIERTI